MNAACPTRDALRRYEAARASGDVLALAAAADALAETCRDAGRPWYDHPGVRGGVFAGGLFVALLGGMAFVVRLPLEAMPWALLAAGGVLAVRWGWQGWPDREDGA